MNEIRLPVRIEKGIGSLGEWGVIDADNVTLCRNGASEYLARQIAIALNFHDALVDALEWYADGGRGYTGTVAKDALAKVEDFQKTS